MDDNKAVTSDVSNDEGFSFSMGDPAGVKREDGEGLSEEAQYKEDNEDEALDTDAPGKPEGDTEGGDEEQGADADDEDGGDEGDGSEKSDESEPLEDLGEFDPEDAGKWDAQYVREDGTLNEENLSKEYFQNLADGNDGLNEGTYEYLAAQRGISKEFAKQVEAALKTQRDASENSVKQQDMELFTLAGGPDQLKAALDWGKKGGYDKAAQKRFNKVMSGKDADSKKEAVELLMARHAKANPGKQKPRVPKRDATKGQGRKGPGIKPFANRSEYRQAKADAGENQKMRRIVAERLAISEF